MNQFPDTMALAQQANPEPLTAADLTAADVALARQNGAGRVLHLHRVTYTCPPCHGMCQQGRHCPGSWPADACTDIDADQGAQSTCTSACLGALLVIVVSVLSYGLLAWAGIAFWPRLVALLG